MKKDKVKFLPLALMLLFTLQAGCVNKLEEKQSRDIHTDSSFESGFVTGELKTGLLIGLTNSSNRNQKSENPTKKSEDQFKALWIYSDSKQLVHKEKSGVIIAPNGKNFYELRNELFQSKEASEYADEYNFYSKYNYYFSYGNISSNLLGLSRVPIFTEKSFNEKYMKEEFDWPFKTEVEWPWYIGNKYACIMNDHYETGGGSFRYGEDTIKMYKVDTLGKINEREKTVKLFDLLGKDMQKELTQIAVKYNNEAVKKATETEKKVMDINNLALARKNGRWIIKLPIFSKYYHEGNGSSYSTVVQYVDYEKTLPKEITSFDILCVPWKSITSAVPKAIDAVSSPNKDILAVLTNTELLIYKNPKLPLGKPQLRIAVGSNNKIVLSQWASGDEAVRWKGSLDSYFKAASQTEPIVYKSENLGFSFTMPKDWAGKYKIVESKDGVRVYFKPTTPADEIYDGALFYILVRSLYDEDHLDRVGEPRTFKAKGIEYIVGGPTDVRFDFNHKEYAAFYKMTQEICKVVATIKVLP